MAKFKRKKKLINSRLQLRLIGVFLAVSCVASLFQVILLNRSLLELAKELTTDGDRMLGFLPGILASNVLMTVGVLGPLTFLVGLLVTHRIAGPAFNMTRYCQALARGEDPGACRIRSDDELWELCDALNAAVTRLRQEPQVAQPATQAEPEVAGLVPEGKEEGERAAAPSPSDS
jgi:hypothetical protein